MLIKSNTKLILRDELQSFWQEKDVFAEVQDIKGKLVRVALGRRTFRFEINNFSYYCKLHTGVGWREIFKNLISLRLPIVGARNEWLALNRLSALGIPTLTPVAYGDDCTNPARRLSFVITRELAGVQQLDHYLSSHMTTRCISFTKRCALLIEVARIARDMHAGGINHRDFYLCHFLLSDDYLVEGEQSGSKPLLYLIDLHRAQLRTSVPYRWLVKDLASLYFSALECGVSQYDCFRFLRHYFNEPLRCILIKYKRLLHDVEIRAAKLISREERLRKKARTVNQ